jgi:hypothetical protein
MDLMPNRTALRWTCLTIAAAAACVAAGCGSTTTTAAPPPPKLPRALAQAWAQQADQIAVALVAGDGCAAETQATALRAQVSQAIDDGRIARRFRGPLVGAVNRLPDRISCTPAPPPKHGPAHDHQKPRDKHKKEDG